MSPGENFEGLDIVLSEGGLTIIGNPDAHHLARDAVDLMRNQGVWPTPQNYELWLYVVGAPQSDLAREILRLKDAGEPIGDEAAQTLARKFLAASKPEDDTGNEGLKLKRELASVRDLTAEACRGHSAYRLVLEAAALSMASSDARGLASLVSALSEATQGVLSRYARLEARLSDATSEARRLHRHIDQIHLETMTDALTGLANRKALDQTLETMCAGGTEALVVAFLDIDHFKRFNDSWGHQTGDQVLRFVAGVLARNCQAPRFAARYGGEEFVLLFPGEDVGQVARLVNEQREEIAARTLHRRSTNECLGAVTISAGIARGSNGEGPGELLSRADQALYRSKTDGRNRVTIA